MQALIKYHPNSLVCYLSHFRDHSEILVVSSIDVEFLLTLARDWLLLLAALRILHPVVVRTPLACILVETCTFAFSKHLAGKKPPDL